jgi:hypothetical protein
MPNRNRKQKQKPKVEKMFLLCPTCSRELKTEYEIMYGCFLCKQDERKKPLDIDDLIN